MRVNDDAFGDINIGEKHLEIDSAAQKLDWTGLSDTEAFASCERFPSGTNGPCSRPVSRAR